MNRFTCYIAYVYSDRIPTRMSIYRMKVLNLSNNRLSELPHLGEGNKNRHTNHSLEKLYLTANCLTDTALDTLAKLTSLRVLHIAYNTLDTLPERYELANFYLLEHWMFYD